jgi:hypothetical protein
MGNGPVVSEQFKKLIDGHLKQVGENVYKGLPTMIPTLYNVQQTDRAWEEFFEVGSVPDIPEFNSHFTTLGVSPGFYTKMEPKEYGGRVELERKFMDDKKETVFDNFAGNLMIAAQRTQEKLGVRAFANSFSSAFDFMSREEAVSLCSSSHTTKSGVSTSTGFANAGTSAMNKTSLAATALLMKNFRNDIGERIDVGNNLAILCGPSLSDLANEIVGTPFGYDTAANDKNMAFNRYKVIPYPYLEDYSSSNWFLVDLDMMKKSLFWLNRISPEIRTTVDETSLMTWISVYFRVAYGFIDWRWIYGHNVS